MVWEAISKDDNDVLQNYIGNKKDVDSSTEYFFHRVKSNIRVEDMGAITPREWLNTRNIDCCSEKNRTVVCPFGIPRSVHAVNPRLRGGISLLAFPKGYHPEMMRFAHRELRPKGQCFWSTSPHQDARFACVYRFDAFRKYPRSDNGRGLTVGAHALLCPAEECKTVDLDRVAMCENSGWNTCNMKASAEDIAKWDAWAPDGNSRCLVLVLDCVINDADVDINIRFLAAMYLFLVMDSDGKVTAKDLVVDDIQFCEIAFYGLLKLLSTRETNWLEDGTGFEEIGEAIADEYDRFTGKRVIAIGQWIRKKTSPQKFKPFRIWPFEDERQSVLVECSSIRLTFSGLNADEAERVNKELLDCNSSVFKTVSESVNDGLKTDCEWKIWDSMCCDLPPIRTCAPRSKRDLCPYVRVALFQLCTSSASTSKMIQVAKICAAWIETVRVSAWRTTFEFFFLLVPCGQKPGDGIHLSQIFDHRGKCRCVWENISPLFPDIYRKKEKEFVLTSGLPPPTFQFLLFSFCDVEVKEKYDVEALEHIKNFFDKQGFQDFQLVTEVVVDIGSS